jgi:hypothetical protein
MQPISNAPLTPAESNVASPPANIFNDVDEQEKRELIAWYSSPEFTRRLLEHMHKAKKKAILEAQEPREQ